MRIINWVQSLGLLVVTSLFDGLLVGALAKDKELLDAAGGPFHGLTDLLHVLAVARCHAMVLLSTALTDHGGHVALCETAILEPTSVIQSKRQSQ